MGRHILKKDVHREMIEMYKDGYTPNEIALAFNAKTEYVVKIVRHLMS